MSNNNIKSTCLANNQAVIPYLKIIFDQLRDVCLHFPSTPVGHGHVTDMCKPESQIC